jgi:hypothetical protein
MRTRVQIPGFVILFRIQKSSFRPAITPPKESFICMGEPLFYSGSQCKCGIKK